MGGFGKNIRFVALNPQEFWRGKSSHHPVTGNADKVSLLFQPTAFFDTTAIIPQDTGAQDVAMFVQQSSAMHLPAETDGFNLL